MFLGSKEDNQKVIKVFAITTTICLVLVVSIFLLTDSFPSGSFSSDSYLIFWPFIFLAVLFGLIAGTYKYNKLKKKNSVGNENKLSAEEEFEIQVESYDNLSVMKSNRGQASLFLGAVIIISIAFGIFDIMPLSDVIYSLIIYIPLTFFIYKGHRWAMYLGIVLWTFEKAYQVVTLNGKGFIVIVLWWLWLVTILYSAIKVENERKKRKSVGKKSENSKSIYTDTSALESKSFCSNCGKEINYKGGFCKFCGNKFI